MKRHGYSWNAFDSLEFKYPVGNFHLGSCISVFLMGRDRKGRILLRSDPFYSNLIERKNVYIHEMFINILEFSYPFENFHLDSFISVFLISREWKGMILLRFISSWSRYHQILKLATWNTSWNVFYVIEFRHPDECLDLGSYISRILGGRDWKELVLTCFIASLNDITF